MKLEVITLGVTVLKHSAMFPHLAATWSSALSPGPFKKMNQA
jgi:hypothetical protein